jgi:AraC-like DNA-binding protein
MPVFLDLHQAGDYEAMPTVDDIKKNHIADLATQKKYGVRFIQYWINEHDGMVFCMMEGPDKEACAAVHREAHGNMPCNIIEIKGGDYESHIGQEGKVNEFDIVENPDGTIDNGSRTFLAIEVLIASDIQASLQKVGETIRKYNGRETNHLTARIVAAFNSGRNAVKCAADILSTIKHDGINEVYIGISAGQPLTINDTFFGRALKATHRLCDVSPNGKILASRVIRHISGERLNGMDKVRMITDQEEKFLNDLLDLLEKSMGQPDFNIDSICKSIGISRAQLYRKIKSLTGVSPNNFLKELRLRKAMRLIRQQYGNVAEIAYETGFANPSYFSSLFQRRFGMLPSQFRRMTS